ncbi:MAG TPA: hypothetical protein PK477_03915, partial [Methanoregulaceae archaeon]|nr:hypothetical protein [Methanoregulaceae archaeon]
WLVTAGTVFFLAAVLFLPELRSLFQFAPVSPGFLLLCILGGMLTVGWFEIYKITEPRLRKA